MIRTESMRIALRGILHNKLRSLLTMLGMLIGVGSVIMLVAVGTGSSQKIQKQIEGLGTNLLQINKQGGFGGFGGRATTGTQSKASNLTAADVTALEDKTQNPDIVAVAPVTMANSVTAVYQGASYSPSSFVGTTPSYEQIKDYAIQEGTFFTAADETQHNRVAVIGETVATNLFGTADPIGNNVQFNGASYQIIGLLKSKGTNGIQDQDDVVMAPLTAVQDTLTGYSVSYSSIDVEASSPSKQADAQAEVTATLETTHNIAAGGTDDFRILNQASLLQTSTSSNKVLHDAARHRGRHQLAGRRHRRHEHHARDSDRADARDRHSQGNRCEAFRHPGAVSGRGRAVVGDRRAPRCGRRHRRQPLQDHRHPARGGGLLRCARLRGVRGDRPLLRALPSESGSATAAHRSIAIRVRHDMQRHECAKPRPENLMTQHSTDPADTVGHDSRERRRFELRARLRRATAAATTERAPSQAADRDSGAGVARGRRGGASSSASRSRRARCRLRHRTRRNSRLLPLRSGQGATGARASASPSAGATARLARGLAGDRCGRRRHYGRRGKHHRHCHRDRRHARSTSLTRPATS